MYTDPNNQIRQRRSHRNDDFETLKNYHQVTPQNKVVYGVYHQQYPNNAPLAQNTNSNANTYDGMLDTPKAHLAQQYSGQQLRDLEKHMGGPQNLIFHYNLTPKEYDFLLKKPAVDADLPVKVQYAQVPVEIAQQVYSHPIQVVPISQVINAKIPTTQVFRPSVDTITSNSSIRIVGPVIRTLPSVQTGPRDSSGIPIPGPRQPKMTTFGVRNGPNSHSMKVRNPVQNQGNIPFPSGFNVRRGDPGGHFGTLVPGSKVSPQKNMKIPGDYDPYASGYNSRRY